MRTSLQGRIALAVSEGVVETAYRDSVGVWTIGIGHTAAAGGIDPKNYIGKKLTIPEIMALFERDISKFEAIVNREVKVSLLQHEFDALVHFVYNTGTLRTKSGAPSQLLRKLNAGSKSSAFHTGFHGWLKPPELRGRRDKERSIALDGKYGHTNAQLFTADTRGKTISKGVINIGAHMNVSKDAPLPAPAPRPQPIPIPVAEKHGFWDWLKSLFT